MPDIYEQSYDCSLRYQATCPLECFVVACARGTRTAQRGSPAPMAEGRAEAEEWLGAEVGGVKLAEKTQGVLMSSLRKILIKSSPHRIDPFRHVSCIHVHRTQDSQGPRAP